MTFPIRGILKLTADLLRRSWMQLTLVTLVCLIPVGINLLGSSFIPPGGLGPLFFSGRGFGPIAWALIAFSWFLHGFHLSAVTEIALRTAASKPIRARRLLVHAVGRAIPILVAQWLVKLIIFAGGLLLVVPGLFLGAAFSVTVPAYVCEGKSLPDAFRRSFDMTRNQRLPIAVLWTIILLTYGIVSGTMFQEADLIEGALHGLFPALPLPPLPQLAPLVRLGRALGPPFYDAILVAFMVLNVGIYLGLRFGATKSSDNDLAEIFE